jgi:glycosyltransferase involved in cell wall biosynthesis
MAFLNQQKNLLIYSGHCAVVGGDAKYLFELLNNLDKTIFNIVLYTDKNVAFEKVAKEKLLPEIHVNYLNTAPVLFKITLIDKFNNYLYKNKQNYAAGLLYRFLNCRIYEKPLYSYLKFLCKILTFKETRNKLNNIYLFFNFFKNNKNKFDTFMFNNGGYPAKEAGLIAIFFAHIFKVKNIILVVHSMPAKKRWYSLFDYVFDYCVSKYCSHVITASNAVKDALVVKRKFDVKKTAGIYCGLADKPLLSANEIQQIRINMGLNNWQHILIICSDFSVNKGHEVLFYALEKLILKLPEIMLLIVGSGTADREHYLCELVKQLKIEHNIVFLGYRNDIHELNSIADIAIVPSITTEATPYTIKEAARAAKPVIVTAVGGNCEAVIPNETGLVVAPNDVDALVEAIYSLLNNPLLCETMGKQGRQLFLKKFLIAEEILMTTKVLLGSF